jgi:hypothetical protein
VSAISLLVGLLRVLLVLLFVRLLGRFVSAVVHGYRGQVDAPRAPSTARLASRDLVRDRVCNTYVARDRAVAATIGGEVEHFCSVACRDAALGGAPALRHG